VINSEDTPSNEEQERSTLSSRGSSPLNKTPHQAGSDAISADCNKVRSRIGVTLKTKKTQEKSSPSLGRKIQTISKDAATHIPKNAPVPVSNKLPASDSAQDVHVQKHTQRSEQKISALKSETLKSESSTEQPPSEYPSVTEAASLPPKGPKDGKPTRFAMRKQKRAKRHRSDGYMLALEMGANSSEDEGPMDNSQLGDAINFLYWIRNPTLQNLAKLRRAVKNNDKDWMTEFLEFDGLGLLFQCLKDLSLMQGFHLSDMVLKMECIMCIREVVNSQTGLDCLLKIKSRKDNIFGRRFATGNSVLTL